MACLRDLPAQELFEKADRPGYKKLKLAVAEIKTADIDDFVADLKQPRMVNGLGFQERAPALRLLSRRKRRSGPFCQGPIHKQNTVDTLAGRR